jgi:hypothetical protein
MSMGKSSGITYGKTRRSNCRFYFVRPAENGDARSVASKLASLDGIQEVYMTEGKYGFVVKAVEAKSQDPLRLASYMKTSLKGKVDMALSHYRCRKR